MPNPDRPDRQQERTDQYRASYEAQRRTANDAQAMAQLRDSLARLDQRYGLPSNAKVEFTEEEQEETEATKL